MMKKKAQKPVNRCFGNNCPKDQEKQREEQAKKLLSNASRRKRANREIDCLLKQFRGKKIIDLLPAIERRCSGDALRVAVERVERKKDKLSTNDTVFFEQFKASLKESR